MTNDITDPKANLRHELEDLTFGSIAGMVGKVAEYPFDTVKVRLQTQPVDSPHYQGPIDCIKSTIRHEGVRGLFKGMSVPLVGAMIENATLFVGYKQIQRMIRIYTDNLDENVPLTMNQLYMAGAGSGALASFILTPVELIKCKLQIQQHLNQKEGGHRYQGPLDAMKHVWKQYGFVGYYRGFLATFLRETGGGVFWFGTYEYTCRQFIQHRQKVLDHSLSLSSVTATAVGKKKKHITKDDLGPSELMVAGGLAGIGYNVSMFPVDVIKSHMQTNDELAKSMDRRNHTFIQTAQDLYKRGGIKIFYRGCGITAARCAPTNALIFMTYELLTRHFGS